MQNFKKHIPNIVTLLRIIGTIILLFFSVDSKEFMIFYVLCGISDVLDGFLARSLNVTSELGSRLDSISDLTFYLVATYKMLPKYLKTFPKTVWVILIAIIAVRVVSYAKTYFKTNKIQHSHSILNKLTGFIVFLLPFIIDTKYIIYFYWIGLSMSAIGTLEDLIQSTKN